MTHFNDLTLYAYGAADSSEANALNIGWLAQGVDFLTTPPDKKFVDRLWRFCKLSVGQTRGLHLCEICGCHEANVSRFSEEALLLGSAEIRVISDQGRLYASPNLIFHYVFDHNYSPPAEFVRAVLEGPCPPENAYYDQLARSGLIWGNTSIPDPDSKLVKFVKTSDGVVIIVDV